MRRKEGPPFDKLRANGAVRLGKAHKRKRRTNRPGACVRQRCRKAEHTPRPRSLVLVVVVVAGLGDAQIVVVAQVHVAVGRVVRIDLVDIDVEIVVPNQSVGDITGDLSSKRGRISNTTAAAGGMAAIAAQVPLSELEGYQSQLKSLTGGSGDYSLNFSHYDPVPTKTQAELRAAFQPASEE